MSGKKNETDSIALYPGTFDPITNGHLSLVNRAVHLFDKLIVAVADNAGKDPMFTRAERFRLAKESLKDIKRVEVIQFDGLLAELAVNLGIKVIIRGLRAVSDFEYEFQMALMNRKLAQEVETVFMMPSLSWVYLSSTIVKDVAGNGGDITGLVPDSVARALAKKVNTKKKKIGYDR